MKENVNSFPLKPCTTTDLAALYGVHYKTMLKWLKPFSERIGERRGRLYSVAQVVIILEALGVPGTVRETEIGGNGA